MGYLSWRGKVLTWVRNGNVCFLLGGIRSEMIILMFLSNHDQLSVSKACRIPYEFIKQLSSSVRKKNRKEILR